jgi:hypothetical protein
MPEKIKNAERSHVDDTVLDVAAQVNGMINSEALDNVGILLGGCHDDFLPRLTRSNLVGKYPVNRGKLDFGNAVDHRP